MRKNLRKIISALLTLAMIVSVAPMLVSAAEADQEYKVVWIGGSFTEGSAGVDGDRSKCFASLVTKWMNDTEWAGKNVSVTGINSGVGGTLSPYGRMRYEKDVLAYDPDLVFIEFNGNDAGMGNYLQAAYAMESMVRRTLTASPKTKIVFLERPEWASPEMAAEAQKYHAMIADYYDVPLMDITQIATEVPDGVSSDGCHPNEKGHAAIAEGIENWLTENVINYPTLKQFTVNPSYVPIIPAYHDAKDYMVADATTGWYVNDNGQLQSDTFGDVLTLKFKGDAVAFAGASGGTDAVCTFVVDSSINESGKEESGIQGSIANIGHCKGVYLGMGTGEHTMTIKNNHSASGSSSASIVIDKIIVDGIENDAVAPVESTAGYNVFYDKISDDTTFYWGDWVTGQGWTNQRRYTAGGGVISKEGNYATMGCANPARGLQMATKGARLIYTMPENAGAVGSVSFRICAKGDYSEGNPLMKVYAIDENGTETLLNVLPGVLFKGQGSTNTNQGLNTYDFMGCGVPAGTKKLAFEYDIANYGAALSNVRYTYGAPTFEKVTMELNAQTFVGSEEQITVKGYNSDGSEYDLSDADIVYYTSDNDIVDVNSSTGTVKAKAAGTAVVNAEITVGDKVFEKSAKITVYASADVSSSWFVIPKNTYVAGTSGKIDFHAVIDGTEQVDALPTTYTSGNQEVVTIDNNGNFKAVGAGTAVITPSVSVLSDTYSPIIIKVVDSNKTVHNFYDDNQSGKLTVANMKNQYSQYANLRNGTELYAWCINTENNLYLNNDHYLSLNEGPGNTRNKYAAFIYKLGDSAEKFEYDYINNNGWSTDPRIAYLSSENYTFTVNDTTYDLANMDNCTSNRTSYAFDDGRTEDDSNDVVLKSGWVEDTSFTKNELGNYEYLISSDVPEGAKYVLVLFDYKMTKWPGHNRLKGANIIYKNEIAAVEAAGDNKIAVTFKGAVENPDVTSFKVNGTSVQATVDSYDADTQTLYLSVPYNKGDSINIEVSGMTYQTVIADDREQISAVSLTVDGEKVEEIPVGTTSCSVKAKVINTLENEVYIIAARYSDDGKTLKDVKLDKAAVTGGEAESNLSFTFEGDGFASGESVRVFCWTTKFAPFMNYNNIQTVFKSGEF